MSNVIQLNPGQSYKGPPANAGDYLDLHTSGYFLLRRVRSFQVPNGREETAVALKAIHGEVRNPVFVLYDVTAVTHEVEQDLWNLAPNTSNITKDVLAYCTIGDTNINMFPYKTGPRKGEIGVAIKGRLLKIHQAWSKDATGSLVSNRWQPLFSRESFPTPGWLRVA